MSLQLKLFSDARAMLRILALSMAAFLTGWNASGQIYVPPASNRADINLDTGWRFIRQDVAGAQNNGFDDSSWTSLNLPHTWNNLDGQDGGNNYYRGIGWYRAHYTAPNVYAGRRFFLKFDGAFSVADVWLNGNYLGEHQGGFAAFVFDATTYVNVGGDNVIAVKVNNSFNTNIPPLSADFTFFGGLYRDVHLLVTDPVQISPMDYGSAGVYLKTTSVSSNSANLQVTTVISNANATAATVTLRAIITDAATNTVAILTNQVVLPAASVSNVVMNTIIGNPHLWNGLSDPYLYQAFLELDQGANALDVVSQPLGFRSFSVDPTNGFFLNGRHYDLHGVNMHQDWLNYGWALNSAQRQTNFGLLKEIGATAVRLSHYEHNEETYQLADQNGIIVWSEIPLINYITESPAFYTNSGQQLREMIRQRCNHPAVVCWSVYNEITLQSGPSTTNLINQLVQIEAQEDPTRPSTAAANTSDGDPSTMYTQLIAFNKYYGWYSSPTSGIGSWADNIHSNYPTRCIGVTEYGAGASIYQHSENPVFPSNTSSPFHPEEWQNTVHEINWQMMSARPFLWCKFVWNMFDFAADGRNEGDTSGRNDKGLASYDRQTRKDAFYFYKANWTTNPMVYITGHTFTNRLTNAVAAKVYANCDSVELFLNGASQGSRTSTNCIYTWPITLVPGGTNDVQAVGTKGGSNVTDSLVWIGPVVPPFVSIISPSASIVYLISTNDTLSLSAVASNNPPNASLAITTAWSQVSGPGAVTFGNSNAPATTANFSSTGIYGLAFTAYNGATSSIPLAVVVNPTNQVQNGLLAWWKMDEKSGVTAADSSGNNVNATVSGAIFTNGFLSNALHFNGMGNAANFASPDTTQITLAVWARAGSSGNSSFPRILDTPGYRLFFRFDSQGSNGFDFATYTSAVNGDWFSGQNTIATGAWYHVAASYDRSSLANVPTLYVNGAKTPFNTITSPSGTTPADTGTGYIGNNAALSRAWSGDLDDLRIYNRLLSDAEVRTLASMPPGNVAPVVNAGTNQTTIWPAAVNLQGTVSDDGKPNSPGAVTVTWQKINGPGTVIFGNSNSPNTTASFSTGGAYVLQLTANDGQVATTSSVTITSITKPTLSFRLLSGTNVELSWQTIGGTWILQTKSNLLSSGPGTQWMNVPGPITSPFTFPINPKAATVFYRLMLTN